MEKPQYVMPQRLIMTSTFPPQRNVNYLIFDSSFIQSRFRNTWGVRKSKENILINQMGTMGLNCDRLAACRTGHSDAIKSSLALFHCARETSAQLAQLSANVVADKLKWQHSPTSLTFATRFLLFFYFFYKKVYLHNAILASICRRQR